MEAFRNLRIVLLCFGHRCRCPGNPGSIEPVAAAVFVSGSAGTGDSTGGDSIEPHTAAGSNDTDVEEQVH